ncbi:hypothetical protein ACI6Q2_08495 [Chitinophagaceae bacterium LWZ2-11]
MALVKLKIQSYDNPACSGRPLRQINPVLNPENYTQNYTVKYENPEVIGNSAQTLFFSGMGSNKLSLKKLIVDGTGVIPLEGADNVDDYIKTFAEIVYQFKGDMHRPPYLKVTWGNLTFKGVCTAFNVEYTLFKPDGTALRAFIDLELSATVDPQTKEKQAQKNSPDLTHVRTVKSGDTLPLMTYRIYGDSAYYLEVAKFNKLKSIHAIKPGDQIYFPPLKK